MPCGPDKTLPVGTNKERDIYWLMFSIDIVIKESEGPTVVIPANKFYGSHYNYYQEVINIYINAGWRFVYWKYASAYAYDNLVLSNDPEHFKEKPKIVIKKNWFQKLIGK